MYIYMCKHVYIYIYIYMCVCVNIYIYTCIRIYIYIYMYYPHVLSRLRMSAWISHVLGLGWDDWPWIVRGPTATMDSGTDSSGSQKGSALDEERRCRKPGWCQLENWWIEWCYGCIMWLSMGAPQNRWFIIENLMKMNDLGVPLF